MSLVFPKPHKLYNIFKAINKPFSLQNTNLNKVFLAYDLGQVKGYSQPAIGASRSKNIILKIGNGKKLVKQYKSTMNFEGITYEHSVLGHLTSNGFTSPRIILNKMGKTCLQTGDGYYAVFDFIPGYKYSDFLMTARLEKHFLIQAGQALARYHTVVQGFAPEGRKLDGFMPDGLRRYRNKNWHLNQFSKYKALFNKKIKTDYDLFILKNIDRLQRCYCDLDETLESISTLLPKLIIHGDYGPYNLLFSKGVLSGILDFECVHLDYRAEELIGSIWRFTGRRGCLNYEKVKSFFTAYATICPVTNVEIEHMPSLFRLSRLRAMINHFRDYFNSGNLMKIRYACESIKWIDWMEKNEEDLIKTLMKFNKP